jgi:hypothetical protein
MHPVAQPQSSRFGADLVLDRFFGEETVARGAIGHRGLHELWQPPRIARSLRQETARRDAKEMLEGFSKDGDISEDERDRSLEDLPVQTDAGVAKVDEIVAEKEKDLMEV